MSDLATVPTLATVTAAALERLEAWQALAAGAYSPESVAAYRRDWQGFTAWCQRDGLAPLPATAATVASYLRAESEAGRALATVKRRAATVALAHRAAGFPDPCKSEAVRLTLRALTRSKGTQQKQAPALNQRDADRIAATVDAPEARAKDVRDLALLLVGRDLMARASELVSITLEAVTFDEDGTATVMLHRSKTSTEALPYLIGPEATEALHRWLEASGITSGPVFVGLTKGSKLTGSPLTRRDVGRVLKALAGKARIEASFSSHSLRVGMAQDLVAENVETAAVMQAGGWRSPEMLTRYTRKLSAKRGAISRYYARRHK
jgi:site-specific recombinase XerD